MTMMSPKTPTPLDSIWIYKPGGGGDYHSPQLHPKDIEYIRADIAKKLKKEIAILKDQMQRLQKIENAADYLLNCIGSEWEQRATNELRNTIAGS